MVNLGVFERMQIESESTTHPEQGVFLDVVDVELAEATCTVSSLTNNLQTEELSRSLDL